MLQLRRLDEAGRRAYLDDVRPRIVVLRLRADKVNLAWGMPLWAAEEIVAFLLGAAALMKAGLPLAPHAWRARLGAGVTIAGRRVAFESTDEQGAAGAALLELFRTVDSLAGGSLRDVLRIPPGESYVKVKTSDTHIEIAAY